MKIFTNKTFTGHYPVGVAAVVLANNENDAAVKLNSALRDFNLVGDAEPKDMILFPIGKHDDVRILHDGNY